MRALQSREEKNNDSDQTSVHCHNYRKKTHYESLLFTMDAATESEGELRTTIFKSGKHIKSKRSRVLFLSFTK